MLKNQFFRFSQTSTIFKLIQSCIISHAYNAQKMHFWQMLFIIIYEHHCLFPVNYLLTNCLYSVYCHLLSVYLVSIAYLLTVYCWPFIYIFYCRFYTFNCISFRECRRNDPKKSHRLHTSYGEWRPIIIYAEIGVSVGAFNIFPIFGSSQTHHSKMVVIKPCFSRLSLTATRVTILAKLNPKDNWFPKLNGVIKIFTL